jgi:HPt (histidine-containing phosphotransfer) domain-containing protein
MVCTRPLQNTPFCKGLDNREGITVTTNETKHEEKKIVIVDSELKDIIPGFLDDWVKEVRSMHEALEKGDYEFIRSIGHNMKGVGGACGFDAITEMGGNLEEAAKVMDQERIEKTFDKLSSYLKRVEVVYE